MPRRRAEPALPARADTDAVPLDRFLAEVGFGSPEAVALARAAIVDAGLSSRPDRPNIHPSKLPAIETMLGTRFVRVCAGCQPTPADPRTPVRVALQDCDVCGGSRNQAAIRRLVDRLAETTAREILVLGGGPGTQTEVRRAWRDCPVRLEIVDGTASPDAARAEAACLRADVIVIWATTMLAHKVSRTYQNFAPKRSTITVARRSIEALADGITAHLASRADLRP